MRGAETNELCWLSMADLGRMIATKEVSPVEVVRAHLDRISALDARLRAFITVCADTALQSARASEADLMAGKVAGPLHGVPWAPKDLYSTKGVRTTGGSKILGDSVPAADATVVARLGAAGAIVLGKLNMHEFAYGPEGLNAHYGDARNPWDAGAHRITGGSSSGSGAAVAAISVEKPRAVLIPLTNTAAAQTPWTTARPNDPTVRTRWASQNRNKELLLT